MTPEQRHEACNQLALASKAHLGLSAGHAQRVLQARSSYYQSFSDADLQDFCRREGIVLSR